MIQIGFLGLSHIHTAGFIRLLKKRQDVNVRLVWDHDAALAARRAQELGAAVATGYRQVLDDRAISAVVIASETNLHEELVTAAAAAGKHMFVEKPMGMGARDCYAMADAIAAAGVIFQTGYGMRGNPIHQFLRQRVRAGAFGRITRVRGSTCHHGALEGWFDRDYRWMADPARAGCGAFGDLGTHSLDLLIWLMGGVDSVAAQTDTGTARYGDCDELGEALIRFSNGAIGTLAASWDDWSDPLSLMISGTEAYAAVINGKLYLHRRAEAEAIEKELKELEGASAASADEKARIEQRMAQRRAALEIERGREPWTELPEPWEHPLDLFLNAASGRSGQPLVSAAEAAYRCDVMEAMYASARERRWVSPQRKGE